MAVFTALHLDDIGQWLTQFPLGKPLALKGIASGIENSNFFLSTERGEYVLTIFENLSFEQLPFYLQLMRHLADRGVLVPAPIANADGELVTALQGKPAAIVSKLDGSSQMAPQAVHCAAVGAMLAKMHLAAQVGIRRQCRKMGHAKILSIKEPNPEEGKPAQIHHFVTFASIAMHEMMMLHSKIGRAHV